MQLIVPNSVVTLVECTLVHFLICLFACLFACLWLRAGQNEIMQFPISTVQYSSSP